MQSNSNSRASLLSGLRTGGVRSASQPSIVPHTAAVGGSFNVPRFASFSQPQFPDDEADELADMINYNMSLNGNHRMMHQQPVTASAADGVGNRFQQQQQQAFMRQMAAQRNPMNGMAANMELQMMQMELMKLQAIQQAQQVQQYQAELMAQAQREQQQQQHRAQNPNQIQRGAPGRRGSAYNEPATAGPTNVSFDLRGPTQNGRSNLPDPYGAHDEMQVPMTAALGGKFGSRPVLSALNPNASVFTLRTDNDEPPTPKTATAMAHGRTTVISGGTSLGAAASSAPPPTPTAAMPTKSDSASSWRRGGTPNGAAERSTARSPSIKLTPPASNDSAPSPLRSRPSPLRFGEQGLAGAPRVDVESGTESDADSYTSDLAQYTAASASDQERDSSPSTPPSAGSSAGSLTREEASKRLYEGLGMGKPTTTQVPPVHVPVRVLSKVLRQPSGPPASVDELGPLNFARRLQQLAAVNSDF
ncbi:hypothetical protein EXIGLDRAFT_758239 [Exidia glandulosa HHB12029]|uniref:Uncharacterized protein n=1 Tax=Exidia glandulosa HHB12029 TaxID=1314781 RepID=A0A165QQ80_EXIGL|nr:hypothetical protein EXIGLDRAFT_758239 [Exidia glandulosa HHB12029]